MRRKRTLALTAAVLGALVVVAAPQAAPTAKKLRGSDGPGRTISMSKLTVQRGAFEITIDDRSRNHNFHLTGPGVNRSTGIPFVGTVKWTVRLKKGTYRFLCDRHPTTMRGTLQVT